MQFPKEYNKIYEEIMSNLSAIDKNKLRYCEVTQMFILQPCFISSTSLKNLICIENITVSLCKQGLCFNMIL